MRKVPQPGSRPQAPQLRNSRQGVVEGDVSTIELDAGIVGGYVRIGVQHPFDA